VAPELTMDEHALAQFLDDKLGALVGPLGQFLGFFFGNSYSVLRVLEYSPRRRNFIPTW